MSIVAQSCCGGVIVVERFMHASKRIALVVVAMALLSNHAAAQGKATDVLSPKCFPMKIGYKWIYAFGDQDVTFEVLREEKNKRGRVFVVRRVIGKAAVDFKVSVKAHGVYIHQEGEKTFSPPLRQFAFFARKEDTWKWRGKVDGQERQYEFTNLGVQSIAVPAGSYSAIAVKQTVHEKADHATFWLVEGIGVVKLSGKTEAKSDDEGGIFSFDWQLKRFEKPKR